jgi:hypothetical protein
MSTEHFLVDFLIGLLAGVVGGISGIGGSIVMLPALGLFHGYESADKARHHVYMAASMMVNIVVALSSSLQHRRQGFVRIDLLKVMVPAMGAGMIGGVLLSSHSPGRWPVLALAVFIWCYCAFTLVTLAKKLPQRPENAPTPPASVLMGIGFATGIFGGYLGVGGGILLVPPAADRRPEHPSRDRWQRRGDVDECHHRGGRQALVAPRVGLSKDRGDRDRRPDGHGGAPRCLFRGVAEPPPQGPGPQNRDRGAVERGGHPHGDVRGQGRGGAADSCAISGGDPRQRFAKH